MKRSPMTQSTKPMKRGGFAAPVKKFTTLCRTFPTFGKTDPTGLTEFSQKQRKPMKTSRPRMTPIRLSARGEECTLRLPGVCNFDTSTTVLCHENGAGAGMKSPDECGVYGCYACHMVLDGHVTRPAWLTRDFVLEAFKRANAVTRQILKRKGLIA